MLLSTVVISHLEEDAVDHTTVRWVFNQLTEYNQISNPKTRSI